MPKKKKRPYDTTMRFRAFKALEARIERIVEARGYGDPADFMREGLSNLVLKEEERLGLPPLQSTEPKRVKYSASERKKKRARGLPPTQTPASASAKESPAGGNPGQKKVRTLVLEEILSERQMRDRAGQR